MPSAELALQPPDPVRYLIIARCERRGSGKLALGALFHPRFDVEVGERDPKPRVFRLLQHRLLGGLARFAEVTPAAQETVRQLLEQPRLGPAGERARVRFGGGGATFVTFFVLGLM